jgi:SAM-dependent methyltransferase
MALTYHRSLANGLTGKYAVVADRLRAGTSILEIGCHTGYFSKALMQRGHKVLGVESDEEAAVLARAAGVEVLQGNVEDEAFCASIEGIFDVIVIMDVLEHLRDPRTALKRLRRCLQPNGRLIVTGPNVAYWAVRKDLLLGRWNYTDGGILDRTHLYFYTAPTWRTLIEDGGFRALSLEPAEAMIPIEHFLLKVPLFGRLIPALRNAARSWFPNVFAIVFLIEAAPVSREP